MSDLMLGMLGDRVGEMRNTIDLQIYDGADARPAALLFDSRLEHSLDEHSLFYQPRKIDFSGRQWLLAFDQTRAASGISYTPAWSTLIGGFALSGLLFWLMLSVINTRANAVRIADKLTAEVREHVGQLNTIFALSPDGFVSFDRELRVMYASPAFARLTGLRGPQIAGLNEEEFSAQLALVCTKEARFPGVAALRVAQTSGASAPGNQNEQRQRIEIGGASRRVLECAIRLSETATVSQILYFRDVTHETEVDYMKSEFLSTAAHELRTPMTSIYGFAELLLERDFGEADRRDFLGTIVRQSKLTVTILNELLDLVRIEERRGKDFTIERVDLRELLREIAVGFGAPEGRKGPVLPAPDGPLWVSADRGKLTQAVSNVLSNAYKYSQPGSGVEIELAESERGACVHIIDHGIGMTPEELARVGERFYRADTSGKIPGTGLGMTIVREIIQLHGGSVTLASEAGAGTTVTLWIPV
jgi:signal transduction histidine kinase